MAQPVPTSPSQPQSVVLDTNVILDLLVFDDPIARPLGHALTAGQLTAWADRQTLQELEWVLPMPSFKLDEAARQAVLSRYRGLVQMAPDGDLSPLPTLPRCRDRDDQKFLILAARIGSAWLVSKDKRVLSLADRRDLPFVIFTPKQAVQALARITGAAPSP
ncbi:putative toxin-antitoxin system toxin component, PIN family [Hyalangium rubrum]|uniref:Toxin-antitoxin system toxin component, PIN family n=1 Tax=Hyalangium rubrum TaxID=3103134 RepID=A0ABU5HB05_9BACT|nr:putative toxin-antitoxin system toxin component, PIN family [Hyalangium sp. s54d21]MDY7229977.1 putative toxin-antitoxin system toxin component, PIN family [Hyalangium sp. s54d21]